jgi:aryl-alcohol dehydrogenase-like predicted oxidoreductase
VAAKVRALEERCARHGVPLRAAALQFVLAHPLVVAVVPGPASPEEARDNAEMIAHPIPPGAAPRPARGQADVPVSYPRRVVSSQNVPSPAPGFRRGSG